MEFEHKSGIYKCTCIGNGKIYVGQSVDLKLRKSMHQSMLKHNRHYNSYLQRSYNKYGEDSFIWEVIEYCEKDKLNQREIFWIEFYNCFNDGFNNNEGGAHNRAYVRTDDFKKELSIILTESWNNNQERRINASQRMMGEKNPMYGKYGELNPTFGKNGSNGMLGKHHTKEANEKNRIAHTGLKNKNAKPIVCIETNVLYESQGDARTKTGISDTSINKCLKGVIKSAGGYHWRYATVTEIKEYQKHKMI